MLVVIQPRQLIVIPERNLREKELKVKLENKLGLN